MVHRMVYILRLAREAVLLLTLGAVLLAVPGVARAAGPSPIQVVASFSVLGDMVREIGGRHVNVVTIVGPNADAHSFEPTPQSVRALASAQVLVSNGLNFEAWLPRLIKSASFSGEHIVVSSGATLRTLQGSDAHADKAHHTSNHDDDASSNGHSHSHADHHQPGSVDPHAWQNLKNGMVYVRNIAEGLAMVDPVHASDYQRRAKKYLATMEKLDAEVRTALDVVPAEYRKAVTAHDAFGYFGDEYGIEFIPLAGLGNTAEPSAREVADLIDRLRQEVRIGIFPEKFSNSKLVEQLAREANVAVGGSLFSDALDSPDEPAGTYLGMFHWNAGQLISVLKPGETRQPD